MLNWEAGNNGKNIVKILYHKGNINSVSYRQNLKGANPKSLQTFWGFVDILGRKKENY